VEREVLMEAMELVKRVASLWRRVRWGLVALCQTESAWCV